MGDIEVLSSECNIDTVNDGRGGIFTWIPDENIEEFNLLYFLPGKVRGNHQHPEFVEYFLVTEGSVVLVTKNNKTNKPLNMLASKGTCFRIPCNTSHAINAISEATCISLLTKTWDSCEYPIIQDDLIEFDPGYKEYIKANKKD